MFQIISNENGEMLFLGTFDMGILGKYTDDMVMVEYNEIKEKELMQYYKQKQEEIKEHFLEIEDIFLKRLLEDLYDCGFNFWETNGVLECFIIPEKMPKIDLNKEEELTNFIYRGLDKDGFQNVFYQNRNVLSAREIIKKYFPMIDVDKMISTIFPEGLILKKDKIAFCCRSEICEGSMIDVYAELLPDYSLEDWHNH